MKLNKNNIKKIIILLLVIIFFNFIIPCYSYGISLIPFIGGILNKPIVGLLMLPIDGINLALNALIIPEDSWNSLTDIFTNGGDIDDSVTSVFNAMISPDKIFKGDITLLNANIFMAEDVSGSVSELISSGKSLASSLKKIVSNVYILLRNIAAAILLCLLIYTGIRILLQSAHPYEQAKWKETLLDWIKALCLLMFMHYLMIGVFYVSDLFVDALSGSFGDTSIIASIRLSFTNTSAFTNGGTIYWIYLIMYAYVTYLTVVFLIAYFKRFVWIIICIIISPIVAVTAALGRKVQTFEKWFKEYIFAVLLQPFHMLIFFILVSIPLGLNGSSSSGLDPNFNYTTMIEQIYILLSISMIRPAEKFLMGLFGFSNSQIAKQGSSESGVKTIKFVTDGAKQLAQMAIQIGTAVATGGTSAAIGLASGAKPSGGENAGPLGPGPEGTGPLDSGMDMEGQQISSERDALNEFLEEGTDPNSTWTEEDAEYNNKKLKDKEENKSNTNELNEAKAENKNLQESDSSTALKEAASALKEAAQELKGKGINQELGEGSKLELKDGAEIDVSDEEFDEAMGGNKFNKLAEKLGLSDKATATIKGGASGLKNYLKSDDFKERADNLWANANQFRDTLYLDDAPQEWKNGYENRKADRKESKKERMEMFLNNKNNIDYVIQNHGLLNGIENCKTKKEIDDKKGKAENNAKEILKQAEPYVNMGITDISTIDKLIAKENKGMTPTEAMKSFVKTELTSRNESKIDAVSKIISERTGLDSNSSAVRTQAKQTMQQAKPYIEAGKRDPEVLDRLVRLENNLRNARVAEQSRTPEKVIAIDKVVDKALKDGLKQIKVTKPNSSAGMKEIEKLMNKELKGRQAEISFKQTTTTKTTQNEPREKIGLAEGPKKPKGT